MQTGSAHCTKPRALPGMVVSGSWHQTASTGCDFEESGRVYCNVARYKGRGEYSRQGGPVSMETVLDGRQDALMRVHQMTKRESDVKENLQISCWPEMCWTKGSKLWEQLFPLRQETGICSISTEMFSYSQFSRHVNIDINNNDDNNTNILVYSEVFCFSLWTSSAFSPWSLFFTVLFPFPDNVGLFSTATTTKLWFLKSDPSIKHKILIYTQDFSCSAAVIHSNTITDAALCTFCCLDGLYHLCTLSVCLLFPKISGSVYSSDHRTHFHWHLVHLTWAGPPDDILIEKTKERLLPFINIYYHKL